MIKYITGVPGAGKSYLGVHTLYANFGVNQKLRDKTYKYDNVDKGYTNINELDITQYEDVTELNWQDFIKHIKHAHELQTQFEADDSEIKDYLNENGYLDCLIILDECHNKLGKEEASLVWWLTYHRHLNHEIILITQNLALVHAKYKELSEFFYKGVPSSRRITKSTFRYHLYTDSRMPQNAKTDTKNIKFNAEIYDTYHSGANTQGKSIYTKFIVMMVIAISVFVGFILYLMNSLTSASKEQEEKVQTQTQLPIPTGYRNTNLPQNIDITEPTETKISIICSRPQNICIHDHITISYKEYRYFQKKYDFEIIDTNQIPKTNFVNYIMFVDDTFLSTIGVHQNEKNNTYNQPYTIPSIF